MPLSSRPSGQLLTTPLASPDPIFCLQIPPLPQHRAGTRCPFSSFPSSQSQSVTKICQDDSQSSLFPIPSSRPGPSHRHLCPGPLPQPPNGGPCFPMMAWRSLLPLPARVSYWIMSPPCFLTMEGKLRDVTTMPWVGLAPGFVLTPMGLQISVLWAARAVHTLFPLPECSPHFILLMYVFIASDPKAVSVPHRPLPSGHIPPVQAVTPHSVSWDLPHLQSFICLGVI